ncbi:MAG: hypothetical protein HY331_09695 [Chloroflexi bacterium]|nr:hypothetical protein [Chloroflexota bacterium]
MNWIDTSLLVYSSVAGHPATEVAERELSREACGSSIQVLWPTSSSKRPDV